MAFFNGDTIIKVCIELAIEDIRKNPWLIEEMLSQYIENPFLREKYGMKYITSAKNFIMNNKISYYMNKRIDKEEYPSVTIMLGSQEEDEREATLGDTSTEFEDYSPDDIKKPISYIVKPFDIVSYDKDTGLVEMPETDDYEHISEGMLAVEVDTGRAFSILDKGGNNGFLVEEGSDICESKLAIIPRYPFYRARKERVRNRESYNIGCHVHGDPHNCLVLYNLVKYALFRYREGLFEKSGFEIGTIRGTDMIKNDSFDEENIYSRFIVLRGIVEESWVKTPNRIIEGVGFADLDDDSESMDISGIKIISNLDTQEDSQEAENTWVTTKKEE